MSRINVHMTKTVRVIQKIAAITMSVLLCGAVLITDTAYAETSAKPITAPCSLVVVSGEKRIVYSIVYSVRIINQESPRIRCLGVKSPAQMKDGKVACVVYTCDSDGERCQQVSKPVNISDMRKNGQVYEKSTSGTLDEDFISKNLEQGVPGACRYQVIPKFPSNLRPQLNQSLPSIGCDGEVTAVGGLQALYSGVVNGSDVLMGAFDNNTGNQLSGDTAPATINTAQNAQVQGVPIVSPAAIAPDAISSDVATLMNDPNTVIAVTPAGYSPQTVQSANTFSAGSDQPVVPVRERTLIQKAGPLVGMAGLTMVGIGVWGQPWFVFGGVGLIGLGAYMTEP